MGEPPPGTDRPQAPRRATPDTTGDGLLYSVLNPLLAEYSSEFTGLAPYQQATLGQIGAIEREKTAWAAAVAAGTVTASEQGGVISVTNNSSTSLEVPLSAPLGSTIHDKSVGSQYGSTTSGWESVAPGGTLTAYTVPTAPAITSGDSVTATAGSPLFFEVTTTGAPDPGLTEAGRLPAGITFTQGGQGTAVLSGVAASGSGGVYHFTITADNGVGSAVVQDFTLTVNAAPRFVSAASTSFTLGHTRSFEVVAHGYPTPTMSTEGVLPAGLSFSAGPDGTATLHGSPTRTGKSTFTVVATNPVGIAHQTLNVNVVSLPTVKVATGVTASVGRALLVVATTGGVPAPTLTESGALPAGIVYKFRAGRGELTGVPARGSEGTYTVTFTATNLAGRTTAKMTLTVNS